MVTKRVFLTFFVLLAVLFLALKYTETTGGTVSNNYEESGTKSSKNFLGSLFSPSPLSPSKESDSEEESEGVIAAVCGPGSSCLNPNGPCTYQGRQGLCRQGANEVCDCILNNPPVRRPCDSLLSQCNNPGGACRNPPGGICKSLGSAPGVGEICICEPTELGVATHTECLANMCVLVSGAGTNRCVGQNTLCGGHYECRNNACTYINGPGPDRCSSSRECAHLECVNFQCQLVTGSGADQCSTINARCGNAGAVGIFEEPLVHAVGSLTDSGYYSRGYAYQNDGNPRSNTFRFTDYDDFFHDMSVDSGNNLFMFYSHRNHTTSTSEQYYKKRSSNGEFSAPEIVVIFSLSDLTLFSSGRSFVLNDNPFIIYLVTSIATGDQKFIIARKVASGTGDCPGSSGWSCISTPFLNTYERNSAFSISFDPQSSTIHVAITEGIRSLNAVPITKYLRIDALSGFILQRSGVRKHPQNSFQSEASITLDRGKPTIVFAEVATTQPQTMNVAVATPSTQGQGNCEMFSQWDCINIGNIAGRTSRVDIEYTLLGPTVAFQSYTPIDQISIWSPTFQDTIPFDIPLSYYRFSDMTATADGRPFFMGSITVTNPQNYVIGAVYVGPGMGYLGANRAFVRRYISFDPYNEVAGVTLEPYMPQTS